MKYYSSLGPVFGTHSRLISKVPHGAKVLEVGCAQGYLSKQMKKNGCTVYGIDIENQAIECAKEFCESTLVGDIEDIVSSDRIPVSWGRFDIIMLGDVLEHLKKPETTLKILTAKYLKPQGCVLISLPNIAHYSIRFKLLIGKFNYSKTGILDDTHLRFYTKKNARDMIVNAGLSITGCESIGNLNYIFSHVGPRYGKIGPIITNIFSTLLAIQFIFSAKQE